MGAGRRREDAMSDNDIAVSCRCAPPWRRGFSVFSLHAVRLMALKRVPVQPAARPAKSTASWP